MADVSVRDHVLHIELSVGERLLAVHGRDIEVPLDEITDVTAVPDILTEIRGLKLPGTAVPGVVALGTWRGRTDDDAFCDFALVHHGGPGVVVRLGSGDYDRILIGTPEPAALLAELGR